MERTHSNNSRHGRTEKQVQRGQPHQYDRKETAGALKKIEDSSKEAKLLSRLRCPDGNELSVQLRRGASDACCVKRSALEEKIREGALQATAMPGSGTMWNDNRQIAFAVTTRRMQERKDGRCWEGWAADGGWRKG